MAGRQHRLGQRTAAVGRVRTGPGRRFLLLALSLVLLALTAWAATPPPATTEWAAPLPDLAGYPWLYLREGTPPPPGEGATLLLFGDVMLGRGVLSEPDPFGGVTGLLQTADLVLGNLEGVIGPPGDGPPPPGYDLRAPPAAAFQLRAAGFDVVGLANNHSLDLGPAGLAQTVAHLTTAGLHVVGAGPDRETAGLPFTYTAGDVRLALLAFNAVPNPAAPEGASPHDWTPAGWDAARATAAVAAARNEADAVVVSLHWGYEYQLQADPAQRRIADALLAAGADLIVGHHPHVVQETAVQGEAFVAYSLGNFVFDQWQGETGKGLALWAVFDGEGLLAVQALPVAAGPRPRLLPSGATAPVPPDSIRPPSTASRQTADRLIARIRPDPQRVGFLCSRAAEEVACRPVDAPQDPETGPFSSGAVDFTGDGRPEGVRREAEQIVVDGDGRAVWRGPSSWRVVDLALGDANDDGRLEAVLALWKEDENGVPRSHPFIVGHRGGRYTLLWGGSAVAFPIHELELGNVTGDGVDDLVVLEETAGDARTLSVWRWHGWGYTLLWRSPPGRYRDLALLPAPNGSQALITAAVTP